MYVGLYTCIYMHVYINIWFTLYKCILCPLLKYIHTCIYIYHVNKHILDMTALIWLKIIFLPLYWCSTVIICRCIFIKRCLIIKSAVLWGQYSDHALFFINECGKYGCKLNTVWYSLMRRLAFLILLISHLHLIKGTFLSVRNQFISQDHLKMKTVLILLGLYVIL